jgi:Domain of unknown function (DUF4124)
MVLKRLVAGLCAVLAGTFGLQFAYADVYTWTDASGRMNVSNLSPPEGAHVTSVIPSPPKSEAREEAAREAARRAEMQALNDRVARLSDQLEQSRREATVAVPAPVTYAPPPVPPYASGAPPAVQYVVDTPPPTAMGCGYAWNDCGASWGAWSWPYFANVVVVRDKNFHHIGQGPGHGTRPIAPQPPGRAPWDPLRR